MSSDESDRTPTMERPALGNERRVPHLVALTGPSVGKAYRLAKPEVTVGRENSDLCLEQQGVSRRHARLLITGDDVLVEDLGSTNGTFVGVERIKAPTIAKDAGADGPMAPTILCLATSSLVVAFEEACKPQ